ncbi:alpha/beta hydrolase domain-containing protein [Calothrix parasitica NIES-267]|uniref:Alpha/beta hydrolase domain-containing protein n=1 Tax=Calothrix parasitica NIES-267 TaxID=1973488 RepID=A0A1Z4LMQ7_9CYAN|nr:alpha/beta hydrolase domain-containing protein [Calothrix parasitica NIES-267]
MLYQNKKNVFYFKNILILVLSCISLFLTSWLIIPAPNFPLLIFAVVAPEISPWLLLSNIITFILSLLFIYPPRLKKIICISSLIGLLICSWQLISIIPTQTQMNAAISQALGKDYQLKIPVEVKAKMRKYPFILADVFRGISLNKTRHITNINFATPAGVPLNMEVYQPKKVGKYPAIVFIYGGSWQSGNSSVKPEFNRYMAARGYTVFAIDYRHAPKYKFPAQLDDVNSALNFIRSHAGEYEADTEKMVLFGRSAGAHLAMLAAYQADVPAIRAVVNYYGPVNLTQGYNEPPIPDPINVRAVLKAFLGGSPQQLPILYKTASPINYVADNLPPTLLIYGSRDHVVEARFGRQMYEKLRDKNKAILLEIPWAEHSFDSIFNGVSNQLALYYTERFIAWAVNS